MVEHSVPTTLSNIKYGTRSKVHFEALEQTLRLRLISGPVDKKILSRNSLSRTIYQRGKFFTYQ